MEKILDVINLNKSFLVKKRLFGENDVVSAVKDVSFSLSDKEILGVVGESGCGKSTIARLLMNLILPDSGQVFYQGEDLNTLKGEKKRKTIFRAMQMVFQNPYSSLNPQMTILDNITFGLKANRISSKDAEEKARYYLDAVGMQDNFLYKYPNSLSGGQRQRVAIARALAMEPRIILADEPVSSLDKSVQAQVLNLFKELREKFGLSIVFISHDLSVVEYMSDSIMVMYMGQIMEYGKAAKIYKSPKHPYTKELLASIPDMECFGRLADKEIGKPIEPPSPIHPPKGCRYHIRCKDCQERCRKEEPKKIITEQGHMVACHQYDREAEQEGKR